MTRRRFYAPPTSFSNKTILLGINEAKHLREVLRLKVGDEAFVIDGEGREFRCSIQSARRDSAELNILEEVVPLKPESPLDLTLALALLKSDKFDLVVQKATELGVTIIQPLITARADIRLRDNADIEKRMERWQRIALEAAKQSGRAVVPSVEPPSTLAAIQPVSELTVFFSERDGTRLHKSLGERVSSVTAVVGPEGGWTDEELAIAHNAAYRIVTLGGRTLRAETAAITAVVLVQHLFGDLR
ncbi:MAG TPA: 16S rRNA (uracil(1498)-N(3))-methyltransferase [Pyrinomonadaceae bacterium]|nr:16S rRNA (uracil(1498)-N(3))-methyltransferase [Pyrinomonadaceae bacterium]